METTVWPPRIFIVQIRRGFLALIFISCQMSCRSSRRPTRPSALLYAFPFATVTAPNSALICGFLRENSFLFAVDPPTWGRPSSSPSDTTGISQNQGLRIPASAQSAITKANIWEFPSKKAQVPESDFWNLNRSERVTVVGQRDPDWESSANRIQAPNLGFSVSFTPGPGPGLAATSFPEL